MEYVSLADAAAECGMTVDELISQAVLDGLLEPVGEENYEPTQSGLDSGTVAWIVPSSF